ncbi:MAG TPA: hypothetical protein VEH04_19235 [Verrucomicrobiae bacterium]|nr:hypothetical protein [Verrucomicrobiae bacterium]
MKTLSVLLTLALLAGAQMLASRLKDRGALPASANSSVAVALAQSQDGFTSANGMNTVATNQVP